MRVSPEPGAALVPRLPQAGLPPGLWPSRSPAPHIGQDRIELSGAVGGSIAGFGAGRTLPARCDRHRMGDRAREDAWTGLFGDVVGQRLSLRSPCGVDCRPGLVRCPALPQPRSPQPPWTSAGICSSIFFVSGFHSGDLKPSGCVPTPGAHKPVETIPAAVSRGLLPQRLPPPVPNSHL